MNKWDMINGAFEFMGALLVWLNVRRIYIDRELKGISWGVQGFFASWGAWNLLYYPALGQYCSFVAGIGLFAGSLVWLIVAAYYTFKEPKPIKKGRNNYKPVPFEAT